MNIVNQNLIRRYCKCCSFCGISGHNITKCNSDRLIEFEVLCSDVVKNMNSKDEFKNWLTENYKNNEIILKAFAIKKSRIGSNDLNIYIEIISEYIFNTYGNTHIQEDEIENDLLNLLLEIRNTYQRENWTEEQYYLNMERLLTLERSISYLNNLNENKNITVEKIKINSKLFSNENENINNLCKCNICYENKKIKNFVKLECNHEFCVDCIINTLNYNKNKTINCALCRNNVKEISSRTNSIKNKLIKIN
jgi:hypothetical protein